MSDFYTEQLIARKTPPSAMMAKVGLIALTVLSVMAVLFVPFAIVLPVIMVVVDYFLFRRMNVEYEYLYVNGDLDIDIIMSKQKRKRKFSTNVSNMEILAPSGSPETKNMQVTKTYDFSSGIEENKKYEMIVTENGQKIKVLFEPNKVILDGMRLMAPRKVIL